MQFSLFFAFIFFSFHSMWLKLETQSDPINPLVDALFYILTVIIKFLHCGCERKKKMFLKSFMPFQENCLNCMQRWCRKKNNKNALTKDVKKKEENN